MDDDAFNELFEEFEIFKKSSADAEAAQARTIEQLQNDLRRVKRQLAEETQAKEEYRDRLAAAVSEESDLRSQLAELKSAAEEQARERVRRDVESERQERMVREAEFTAKRATAERDDLADKVILLETDVAELQSDCSRLRGELARAHEQQQEARRHAPSPADLSPSPPGMRSSSAVAEATSPESDRAAFVAVAERLRKIAERCRQRPSMHIKASPSS